ncbi:MAG: HEAT repeat domain-containing protein [Blastocatellia bacterium]
MCSLIVVLMVTTVGLSQEQPSPRDEDPRKPLLARLSSGGEEQRLDAVTQLVGMFSTASVEADFSAITALAITMRNDASPVVRAMAARALEVSGDPRAAEPLITALGSEREVAVRKAIIYGLARYPSPQATSALIPLLKDKQREIRGAAAYALAEIRDPASAAPLLEYLRKRSKDEDAFGRNQAIRALGFVGDQSAIEPLLKALIKDKWPDVRREAACSLGRLASQQDAKVLEALREATLDSDPYLSLAAKAAIAAVNSRSR